MKRILLTAAVIALIAGCKNKTTDKEETSTTQLEQMVKMPKPKVEIKTVGILLYDNYAVLDAMGPYQVLSTLPGAKVFFVGTHKGLITTGGSMKVQCDTSINEVKQLDILVITRRLNGDLPRNKRYNLAKLDKSY